MLLRDVGSLALANVLGKALWALSLVLMMRLLGPEAYGQLVVIWSVAGIAAPLTDLGLSQLLLREGARDAQQIPGLVWSSLTARLVLGGVATGTIASAGALGIGTLGTLGAGIIALAAIAPLVDSAFMTATAEAQARGRLQSLAFFRVLSFAILPAILFSIHALGPGVGMISAAWITASTVGLLGYFMSVSRRDETLETPPSTRGVLARSRPFLFMNLAAWSYGRSEVAILGLLGMATAAAFYHASYQVVLMVFSVSDVFFAAVFATLYRAKASTARLRELWQPLRRILCCFAALSVPPLWIYANDVMAILGGESFGGSGDVLRALLPMVAVLPIAASFQYLLLVDRPDLRAWIDGMCVVLTGGAVVSLAPFFGPVAAAAGATMVYIAACFTAWAVLAAHGLRLDWLKDQVWCTLIVAPALALILIVGLPWWASTLLYCSVGGVLLLVSGFIRPSDFDQFGNLHRGTSP